MATRVVKAALFRYRDSDGVRKMAFFGDEVELPKDEIERGDQLGVFNPAPIPAVVSSAVQRALETIEPRTPEPFLDGEDELPLPPRDVRDEVELPEPEISPILESVAQPAAGGPVSGLPEPGVEQTGNERPKKSATVDVWEDYVVKQTAGTDNPITPEQAKSMNKTELMAAVPASDG